MAHGRLSINPNELAPILRRLPCADVIKFSSTCVRIRDLVQGSRSLLHPAGVAYAPHFVLAVDDAGNAYRWAEEEAGVVLQRRRAFTTHWVGGAWESVSEPLMRRRGWAGGMPSMPGLAVSRGEVVAAACGMRRSIHVFKLSDRRWLPLSGDRAASMAQAAGSREVCQDMGWDAATQSATVVVRDADRGVEALMATSCMGYLAVVNTVPATRGVINSLANGASSYAVVTRDAVSSMCRMYGSAATMHNVSVVTNTVVHPTMAQQLAWLAEAGALLRRRGFWPADLATAEAYLAHLVAIAPGMEPMTRSTSALVSAVYGGTVMHVEELCILTTTNTNAYTPLHLVFIGGDCVAQFDEVVTTVILANEAVAIMTVGADVVRLDRTAAGWVSRVVARMSARYGVFRVSDNGDYGVFVPLTITGDLRAQDPCALVYCGQPC